MSRLTEGYFEVGVKLWRDLKSNNDKLISKNKEDN